MSIAIIAVILAITTIILSISATVIYSKKTISMQKDYNSKIDALTKTIDVKTQKTDSQIQDQLTAYSLSFSTSNLVAPKISSENIKGINAYFTGLLSSPLIKSENITASELSSSRLNSSVINTSSLVSSEITSKLVTSEKLTGNQGEFVNLTGNQGNFTNLTGNQGTFSKISGNISTDEINDAPGGSMLNINKNNQNVVGNEGVAIYNGVTILNGGGLSVGKLGKVPEGQVIIRDKLQIGNNIITSNGASFGGEDLLSSLPALDGNTYIRPGKLTGSVYLNDKGDNTYIGGTGTIYANNSIMFTKTDPVMERNNGSSGDRYGISLSNNAQRMYASSTNKSSVNMSFANDNGTYNDIITVNNNGMTQINGPMSMNNVALSNNLFHLRSFGDSNNILAYADNNPQFGVNKSFKDLHIDGPVLAGCAGGVLGTRCGADGDKGILTWDNQNNVKINGKIDVSGAINSLNTINTPMIVSDNAFIKQNLDIEKNLRVNGKLFTNSIDGTVQLNGSLKLCDASGSNCRTI